MKAITLFALLTFGLVAVAGCHLHHRRSNYSDGYYSR